MSVEPEQSAYAGYTGGGGGGEMGAGDTNFVFDDNLNPAEGFS